MIQEEKGADYYKETSYAEKSYTINI